MSKRKTRNHSFIQDSKKVAVIEIYFLLQFFCSDLSKPFEALNMTKH